MEDTRIVQTSLQGRVPSKSVRYLLASRSLGNTTTSAYLRLTAVAAIVWFHTKTTEPLSSGIGGIGLVLFLYLSFLHAGRRQSQRAAVKRLTVRLLVPWAAWWLFYAVIALWMARGVPRELTAPTSISEILSWPSMHLWYLPFVYFTSLGLLAVSRITSSIDVQKKVMLALLAGLGLLPIVAGVKQIPFPAGIAILALPAIGLGLVYGYCLRISDRRRRFRYLVAIATLVSAACISIWFWGDRTVAIAYTGSALLMITFALTIPRYRLLMRLSTLTLGIYLSQQFGWLVLCKFWTNFAELPHCVTAPTTLILASLMTWVILQIRYLRAIV